jgi:hypothetical protein
MRSTPQVDVASRIKSISSPQDIDRTAQEQKGRRRYGPRLYSEHYHPLDHATWRHVYGTDVIAASDPHSHNPMQCHAATMRCWRRLQQGGSAAEEDSAR